MFCFEILQVDHIFPILRCLLVFRQVLIVLVFSFLSLRLKWLLFGRRETLPVFSHQLGNFREREISALEVISHLWKTN